MVKYYKTKNLDSYYLEMGATEGFMRAEIEKLEEENKTLYKKLQEIGENNFELKKENKKLQEKVNTYSEEYGKLREEKKKLKGEEIVKKLYTLIDNLTLIADNGIYIYSRDEIREYIEGLILGIQGKSDF